MILLQKIEKIQGQADSLYRNIRNRSFDLPDATQNNTVAKCAKTLACVLAILAISGCVSQDSAFDFNGTPVVQPVPTGVTLGDGTQNASLNNTNAPSPTLVSNIPVKAPRPSVDVASSTVTQSNGSSGTSLATTPETPVPTATLAVVETPAPATPTASVIEEVVTAPQTQTPTVAVPSPKPATAKADQTQNSVEVASLSPTVEAAPTVQSPEAPAVKKKSFFERLFTAKEAKPRPKAGINAPKIERNTRAASRIDTASSIADRPSRNTKKPKIKRPTKIVASIRSRRGDDHTSLPGVKSNSEIFGITNDDGSTSRNSRNTQVAAVGSFGRLSPNGLRVQHSKVQVACIKPGVIRLLKMVERRYGKKPIITSGYRSPRGNRRAGGARNSQHIFCKAVDIQVEGVSKWKLAKFLRTLPGRGGVGTYCRTKSVHIDIGSVRDWHHPCRKSSKRKRKRA